MIPITEFLAKAREWQKQNTDWQLYCDFNDRSHEERIGGNQQLPVDLSSIGRLKATCPIFEDGHGDHGL